MTMGFVSERVKLGVEAASVGISTTAFAALQLYVEIDKAIPPSPRFPQGLASLNPGEELIEGGAPALMGALIGLALFRKLQGEPKDEGDLIAEQLAVGAGAVGGYFCAAILVGPLLHQILGVNDFHLFPR